jgi:hypothetical protein
MSSIPGNHNTCNATVSTAGEACARTIHASKANGRIPDAHGASPHPMVDAGNIAHRGPANVPPSLLKGGIPGSHNGEKGMLA